MGLKSIFDAVYIDSLIQQDDSGQTIIYPHGMLGRGYIVPAEREPILRRRLRMVMAVALVIGISLGMLLLHAIDAKGAVGPRGWAALSVMALLLFAGLRYVQGRLARGLEPLASARVSRSEWLRRARRARPVWTYWLSIAAGALMGIASVAAIALGISDGDKLVAVSGIVMIGISVFAAWDGWKGVKERRAAE